MTLSSESRRGTPQSCFPCIRQVDIGCLAIFTTVSDGTIVHLDGDKHYVLGERVGNGTYRRSTPFVGTVTLTQKD